MKVNDKNDDKKEQKLAEQELNEKEMEKVAGGMNKTDLVKSIAPPSPR